MPAVTVQIDGNFVGHVGVHASTLAILVSFSCVQLDAAGVLIFL